MELTKENFRLFGLTFAELRVLNGLMSGKTMNISELSRISRVNRTTILPVLLRLKKRGLARVVRVGKHKEWKMAALPAIKKIVGEQVSLLEKEKPMLTGIDTRDVGIAVYKGIRQIKAAYEKMLDLSKTERVYFIQSFRSAKLSLEKLEAGYLMDFHKKFKKAHIIMEGAAGENILSLYKNLTLRELESYKERMVIAFLTPDKYTNFATDIIIMRDTVLLVNLEDEFVVFIKNKGLTEIFKSVFSLYRDNGRKINLSTLLDEEIKKR